MIDVKTRIDSKINELSWEEKRYALFELMFYFASKVNREKSHADIKLADMAHDFAEIVTHRSDQKPVRSDGSYRFD